MQRGIHPVRYTMHDAARDSPHTIHHARCREGFTMQDDHDARCSMQYVVCRIHATGQNVAYAGIILENLVQEPCKYQPAHGNYGFHHRPCLQCLLFIHAEVLSNQPETAVIYM
jgi:hypothetical protein